MLYYVFDLLYLDGYDLRRVSLEERKDGAGENYRRGMARSATPIIFPRARRCSMWPDKKGWKEFWPSAGAAFTRSAAAASG